DRAGAARATRAGGSDRPDRRATACASRNPSPGSGRPTGDETLTGGAMIGIIGGGVAAAKVVEAYREAGGSDRITIWSNDPHGPYHRPPLSKRLLRGESQPADALVHPLDWYAEHDVDLRTGEVIASLADVDAETVVIATGARPRKLGEALVLRTLDDSLELRRPAEQ